MNVMNSILNTDAYKTMSKCVKGNKRAYQYFLGDVFDLNFPSESKNNANEEMQAAIAEEWNTMQTYSLLRKFGEKANRSKANAVITKSLREKRNEALKAEEALYDAIVNTGYAEDGTKGKQSSYSRLTDQERTLFWTLVARGYYNPINYTTFSAEGLCYALLCSQEVRTRAVGKYHTARAQRENLNKMMSKLTGIEIGDKEREEFEAQVLKEFFSEENNAKITQGFIDLLYSQMKISAEDSFKLNAYIKTTMSTKAPNMTYSDLVKMMTKLGEAAFLRARAKSNNAFDKIQIKGEDGKIIFTYVAGKGRIASSKEKTARYNKHIKAKNQAKAEKNATLPEDQQRGMTPELTAKYTFFNGIIDAFNGTTWNQEIKTTINGVDYTIKPDSVFIKRAANVLKNESLKRKFERNIGGITDRDLNTKNAGITYDKFVTWFKSMYKEDASIITKALKKKQELPEEFSSIEGLAARIGEKSTSRISPYFTRRQNIVLGESLPSMTLGDEQALLTTYFSTIKQKTPGKPAPGKDRANDKILTTFNLSEDNLKFLFRLLKFISINEKFIMDHKSDFTSPIEENYTFQKLINSLVFIYYPAWATSNFGDMGGLIKDTSTPLVFLKKNDYVYPLSQIYKEIFNNFDILNTMDKALSYSTQVSDYKTAYMNMDVSKNLINGGNINYKNNFKIRFAGLTISLLSLSL